MAWLGTPLLNAILEPKDKENWIGTWVRYLFYDANFRNLDIHHTRDKGPESLATI